MRRFLSCFILGLATLAVYGCGSEPATPKGDEKESKEQYEEISKGMEEAMKEQMKGGGGMPKR